jgi:putative two-component system response regulator
MEIQEKPKVLIVDDDANNIRVLVEILRDVFATQVALNGEIALKIIKSGNIPDIILLDVIMPGMSGFDLCRLLKKDEKYQRIPIIFVSALSEEADEAKGLELGAVDYITKPFSAPIVKARLKNHLELKKYRDFLENQIDLNKLI